MKLKKKKLNKILLMLKLLTVYNLQSREAKEIA